MAVFYKQPTCNLLLEQNRHQLVLFSILKPILNSDYGAVHKKFLISWLV
jgi:hypothetical protein